MATADVHAVADAVQRALIAWDDKDSGTINTCESGCVRDVEGLMAAVRAVLCQHAGHDPEPPYTKRTFTPPRCMRCDTAIGPPPPTTPELARG